MTSAEYINSLLEGCKDTDKELVKELLVEDITDVKGIMKDYSSLDDLSSFIKTLSC